MNGWVQPQSTRVISRWERHKATHTEQNRHTQTHTHTHNVVEHEELKGRFVASACFRELLNNVILINCSSSPVRPQ